MNTAFADTPFQGHAEFDEEYTTPDEKLFTGKTETLEKRDVIQMTVSQVLDGSFSFEGDEFFAEVTEAKVLSDISSMTYQYYFDNVKPKPQKKIKGYVCKICGYVYEGDTLPPDFICPLCKHGAEDFEPIE